MTEPVTTCLSHASQYFNHRYASACGRISEIFHLYYTVRHVDRQKVHKKLFSANLLNDLCVSPIAKHEP